MRLGAEGRRRGGKCKQASKVSSNKECRLYLLGPEKLLKLVKSE